MKIVVNLCRSCKIFEDCCVTSSWRDAWQSDAKCDTNLDSSSLMEIKSWRMLLFTTKSRVVLANTNYLMLTRSEHHTQQYNSHRIHPAKTIKCRNSSSLLNCTDIVTLSQIPSSKSLVQYLTQYQRVKNKTWLDLIMFAVSWPASRAFFSCYLVVMTVAAAAVIRATTLRGN